MRYLQCDGHVTQAEKAEQAWMNARAVAECRYDLTGSMTNEYSRTR